MKLKFEDVKKLVDKYDIVGLIYEGGGDDEYDFETRDIVDHLDTTETLEQVKSVVTKVFVEAFDKEIIDIPERELCNKLASDIWNLIHEKKNI